ncbi:male-specific lethal 3 homolog isoform X1 [Octopus sinensis]|uniref:Male-specific lethal 3 homolog isoform X1 n=2 Tax=Octopus sinensis TaxID=2607531 RepID=A0A6P7TQ16_9MOLL|nr:male-specific lethal 3 homolog isoform X1 [Octopus sinensis]
MLQGDIPFIHGGEQHDISPMASGRSREPRTLKYNFHLGELVLCFEPDPTKARVLYDAKILDTAYVKDKSGRNMPAYRIHFQGWNSSWDRTVGENYILKGTEENRTLMKQLAETAKCYRNNKARKNKIDDILEKAFKHKPLSFDSSSDCESSEESSEPDGDANRNNGRNGTNGNRDDDEDENEEESNDVESGIELTIPKVLRQKLEEDCYMINKKKKFLRLPAEINVVSVLEGYVKNFSVNVLYGLSDRCKQRGNGKNPAINIKSIPICREVVDGIRVCFDFSLSTILLYSFEKDHYSKFISHRYSQQKLSSPQPDTSSCSPVNNNTNNCSSQCTPEFSSSCETGQRDKIRRISENCVARSNSEEISTDSECSVSVVSAPLTRRVTRQSVAETARISRKSKQKKRISSRNTGRWKPVAKCSNSSTEISSDGCGNDNINGSGDFSVPSASLSATLSSSMCSKDSKQTANQTDSWTNCPTEASFPQHQLHDQLQWNTQGAVKTETVDAASSSSPTTPCMAYFCDSHLKIEDNLPLPSSPCPQIAAVINPSCAESNMLSLRQALLSSCHRSPCQDLLKEVFHSQTDQSSIDEIFTWRLLPQSFYSQCPPQPSIICGPQQLLRLFVKLPEVLGKMDLPELKLGILLGYLENFLEYMAARHEDLFPASAYVDAV